MTTKVSQAPITSAVAVLVLTLLVGFGGGVALWFITDWASKSATPLRGNAALVIPVAGGALLLTVGWTVLTLWRRGITGIWRWAAGCLLAAILGVVLTPVVFYGPTLVLASLGVSASVLRVVSHPLFQLALLLVVLLLSLLLALSIVGRGAARESRAATGWTVLGYLLLPIGLVAGIFLGPRIIPLVAASAGPIVATSGHTRSDHTATWLVDGSVLVAEGPRHAL